VKKDDFFFVKILNFFSFFLLVNSIPKFEDREIEVLTLTLRAQEGDDIPIFTFFYKAMLEKISTAELRSGRVGISDIRARVRHLFTEPLEKETDHSLGSAIHGMCRQVLGNIWKLFASNAVFSGLFFASRV
jgi:hypothetical protein